MKKIILSAVIALISAIIGFAIGVGLTMIWVNDACKDAEIVRPGESYFLSNGGKISWQVEGEFTITNPTRTRSWSFTPTPNAIGVGILNDAADSYGPLSDITQVSKSIACIRPSSSQ